MRSDAEIWPDPSARPPAADRAAIRRIASKLTPDEVERHGGTGFGWYAPFLAAEQIHTKRVREAESPEAKERAELRAANQDLVRRVARLEKLIGANLKAGDYVAALLKGGLATLDRVRALEQRPTGGVTLPSANDIAAATRIGPAVHDAGVWSAEQRYQPGDLATHVGCSWVATTVNRGVKPGDGAGVWRLVHKTEQAHVRRLIRDELALQQKGPALR
jgi:hypothetical protein